MHVSLQFKYLIHTFCKSKFYTIPCTDWPLGTLSLGRPIKNSISEDPQPHPQSLRFFKVEDRHFRNFEVFRGWGLHKTFEVFEDLPSKNLKVWGEDEVYSFEVFRGFLEIPRKIQPKGAFINYIDRF